jgi:hypothetical protein
MHPVAVKAQCSNGIMLCSVTHMHMTYWLCLQDSGETNKDVAPRGPFNMLDIEKLGQKLMELREVLLEGADYRPIEILDELSAM